MVRRHLVPIDPEGPTVLTNRDCPILLKAIKYHQDQYPDVYAQEVEDIVKKTYGEVAVCKIAHGQSTCPTRTSMRGKKTAA